MRIRFRLQLQVLAAAQHAALALEDHISEDEKGRRLTILQEKQRGIQIRRNSELVGNVQEVMVEGYNSTTTGSGSAAPLRTAR